LILSDSSPYRDESSPRHAPSHKPTVRHHARPQQATRASTEHSAPARKRGRRSRRAGTYAAEPQLTSHPTSRAAYVETRVWLLAQHGPICAYCARRFEPGVMTLDHVAPRRGRTAYDRRDNLVLACPACNAAKRDMAPLAFLLANRTRAANLLRYGSHLSPMLVDLARQLAPADALAGPAAPAREDFSDLWAALLDGDDDASPYKD